MPCTLEALATLDLTEFFAFYGLAVIFFIPFISPLGIFCRLGVVGFDIALFCPGLKLALSGLVLLLITLFLSFAMKELPFSSFKLFSGWIS